jgi:hypothetical protein
MPYTKTMPKQSYNEKEAAEALGISVPLLHAILDKHIFNDGTLRPENVEFTPADLLMISYWVEGATARTAVAMSGA